jgi:uncharacterized membrane protein YgcG
MTIGLFFFLAVIVGFVVLIRHAIRHQRQQAAKQEAYFTSMFPDLQPYYHPKNVFEFVRARLAQAPARGGMKVPKPPGFGVDAAEVFFETDKKGREREVWRLLDAAGAELSRFTFDSDAKDGMVRVGEGKFRVGVHPTANGVRYWHPDREFKWTPQAWKFVTRVFEEPVQTSDHGSLSFGDSSSSGSGTSRAATAAAAATAIAAAGGTFDGGGASAAWDGKSDAGGSSDTDSDTAAATTSY